MVVMTKGKLADRFHIVGLATYPVHLLDWPKPVIFDSGPTCAADLYVKDIRAILGDREPYMLFISHVHWDHCGGASYLKKAFPSMKIAASARAAEVLTRPRAIKLITGLNKNARSFVSGLPGMESVPLRDEDFEPFDVDVVLKDGDVIDLTEGQTVQAMATPGHTRDHMTYYLPREEILLAAEASGCLAASGEIIPEFLSDFDSYFAALTRMSRLPVRVLSQGHRVFFVGEEEVRSFFDRSVENALRFKTRICDLLEEEEGSVERVVQRIKKEQYDPIIGVKQPEVPYLLNLTAQVTHLAGKRDRS